MNISCDELLLQAVNAEYRGDFILAQKVYGVAQARFPADPTSQRAVRFYKELRNKGQSQDALEAYTLLREYFVSNQLNHVLAGTELALTLHPISYELWELLGLVNYQVGRASAAVTAFQKAISINPENPTGYSNLGVALRGRGEAKEAILAYKKSLEIQPNDADIFVNMGVAFDDLGIPNKAIKAYLAAIEIDPENYKAHNNLGSILKDEGNFPAALNHFKTALRLKKDHYSSYLNIAKISLDTGNISAAISLYQKVLKIRPKHASAIRCLSTISAYSISSSFIDQAEAGWGAEHVSDSDKCELGFALYNAYKRQGDYKRSFGYLKKANEIRRNELGFNLSKSAERFSYLYSNAENWLDSSFESSDKDQVSPIFICGLPRSGTTLVEQILSNHSNIFGLGELPFVERIMANIDPDCIAKREGINILKSSYISQIRSRFSGCGYVTDKMPHNFLYLPLLVAAFPTGRFIHVYRNAAATLWSSYERYFPSNLSYVYDLSDLTQYYQLYRDLMIHYKGCIGSKIYDLNYEELTKSPDVEIPKLMEYVGLQTEDMVLKPHLNPRSVATYSNEQIRSPIYTGSSEKWRVFEPFINGALDEIIGYGEES